MEFNPISLQGRKYLITGAASGIGRETSVYLSKLGADLILSDIDAAKLSQTKGLCKSTDFELVVDLTNFSDLKDKLENAVNVFGKLNGFVHCAGRPYVSPLKTINEQTSISVFNINAYAAIELAKILTNKKNYSGENGSIVLISSVYGLVGSSANAGYAMSKGAINAITKALAIELAPRRIRVNAVAPGFIKTEMADNISDFFNEEYDKNIERLHPLGWGKPDYIAAGIAFLLSDMSQWITGSIIYIDGGFTAQ